MAKSNVHVVPHGGRWAAQRAGAERASRLFDTQAETIAWANLLARQDHVELFIHRPDGTIRDRDSFGNDPNPPRDTKH